jgi:hypothetical protein
MPSAEGLDPTNPTGRGLLEGHSAETVSAPGRTSSGPELVGRADYEHTANMAVPRFRADGRVPAAGIGHASCRSAASGAVAIQLVASALFGGGPLDRVLKCDTQALPKGGSRVLDSAQELGVMLQAIVEPVVL